ncbi:hypothetical protein OG223_35240 [Streptomyces sp. NBC_01478]|uniref:hypothetical protein n=1 Tax=Streptomyces sp. NBC_01478 TaxID=2903882 RepID=UPI002E33FCF3|nr:hypothetical protein [Streptomyces sp. NBC_01478]
MKRTFRIALVVAPGLAFGGAVSLESPPTAVAAPIESPQPAAAAAATPGDAYNLSPTSRTLAPTAVHATSGSVGSPTNVLSHQATRLNGKGSAVTLDFGKEVGGIVTLNFSGASGAGQSVGLAFSESSLHTGTGSDNSADGTPCTNAVFGDPIPGTAKSCHLLGTPPTTTTWTTCAAEAGTCAFTGTHEVAFGANGQYVYGSYSGGTPCPNTVSGDPISGASESCYVQ